MITISRLYDDYNTAARVYNDLDARRRSPAISASSPTTARTGTTNRPRTRPDRHRRRWRRRRTEGAAPAPASAARSAARRTSGRSRHAGDPGLGPVVAAGWLVSTAALAITGGAAGGLIGSLTQHGVSEDDATPTPKASVAAAPW